MPEQRVSDELLNDLRYIADPDQPTPDNGGFHPTAREAARRAIERILGQEAEIVRLNGQTHFDASAEEAARLRERVALLEPVVKAAVVMRRDYPQLAPVSEINRWARNNGLPDDPRYALLLAVDALHAAVDALPADAREWARE